MAIASSNWVHGEGSVSLSDKVRSLLLIRHQLVKVQADELDRIRLKKTKDGVAGYINYLYNNYIVHGLPKTYLQQL